jgi:hypothetical protein
MAAHDDPRDDERDDENEDLDPDTMDEDAGTERFSGTSAGGESGFAFGYENPDDEDNENDHSGRREEQNPRMTSRDCGRA